MTKRLALVGVMTLAMLAACSKQAPPPADAEAEPAARAEKPAAPPVDREKMAQDMLGLIDTAPQCQQYRTQLEELSKRPPDQVTTDDMSEIVAQSYRAGCGKKR